MDTNRFSDFLASGDTLRVYRDDKLLFTSRKKMLIPLLEFIDNGLNGKKETTIMDKMVGNAAALLAIYAGGSEVLSPVGSEIAVKTLERYGIKHNFITLVTQVKSPAGDN
jgi:hypothetical protein